MDNSKNAGAGGFDGPVTPVAHSARRGFPAVVAAIGLAEAVFTLVVGLTVARRPIWLGLLTMLPLLLLMVFLTTGPLVTQRQRLTYPLLVVVGFALTIAAGTFGMSFPLDPVWWIPAAVLIPIPFLVLAGLELRRRR